MNWKPMSELEEDGEDFLAWSANGYAVVVSWDEGWGKFFSQDGEYDGGDFTHWAPIDPPNAE